VILAIQRHPHIAPDTKKIKPKHYHDRNRVEPRLSVVFSQNPKNTKEPYQKVMIFLQFSQK
jgi:hypothetical protein